MVGILAAISANDQSIQKRDNASYKYECQNTQCICQVIDLPVAKFLRAVGQQEFAEHIDGHVPVCREIGSAKLLVHARLSGGERTKEEDHK